MTRHCFVLIAGLFGCVAVTLAGDRGQRSDAPSHVPSGVVVISQAPVSADDLPFAPAKLERARVREVRLADGTGLAHLDGQVLEESTARVVDGRVQWGCSAAGPGGGHRVATQDFRDRRTEAHRDVR